MSKRELECRLWTFQFEGWHACYEDLVFRGWVIRPCGQSAELTHPSLPVVFVADPVGSFEFLCHPVHQIERYSISQLFDLILRRQKRECAHPKHKPGAKRTQGNVENFVEYIRAKKRQA